MLGPVASGLLMSYSSMLSAIVVLALYSLGAWVPEAALLQSARRHSHRLRCDYSAPLDSMMVVTWSSL
jgi:hypothetical protein